MKSILLVGEDQLCCALGERLIQHCLPDWSLALPPINKRGRSHLVAALPRYIEQARLQPVLCIADTDSDCVRDLRSKWLPRTPTDHFMLRLAETEAESWALADASAFADAFAVPRTKVPNNPDGLSDPKMTVLTLARRSKRRQIRQEVVSAFDQNKPGTGYNEHLCSFVRLRWRPSEAVKQSKSLQRAAASLRAIANP
jgi:hypothetical protein